ncbi:YhdP family protein [Herminiimonas glaciei]|uniref:YhdP family protein n=1 Tax=Herminiimonas glaciei TaxID=523788 RepID=A0ABW2IBJ0_9BURK
MPTDQRPPEPSPNAHQLQTGWRSIQACVSYANRASFNALCWLGKLLLVAYFIFCVLFLGLRYVVLPQISNYRVDVENVATKAIGRPVTIGSIDASWHGLRPFLSLDNVAIYDKAGDVALRLPKVSATVSWWSVMVADLRLHSLQIEKPDMDVERDANGNFYVAGMLIDMQKDGDGKAANWILSQREIRIKDGRLRWQDKSRQAPELLLSDVNMVLHNEGRHHQFALKATPPAAIAAPLDVRAAFDHPYFSKKISDATRWTGTIYTAVRDTELAAWKTYIDFPFELQQAKGSLRAWLSFDHARIADLTADLALSDVSAQLRKDLVPLELTSAYGRIAISEPLDASPRDGKPTFGAQGYTISLMNFALQTRDGLVLPSTTLSKRYVAAKKDVPEHAEVLVKQLDLQAWANFAGRLPLPEEQLRMISDFAPRGLLKDFSAQWTGAYPEIASYKIKGDFANLALNAQPARSARAATASTPAQAAVPAIPGFENLSGRIDANSQGGNIVLASDQLKLALPTYFSEPEVAFDTFNMDAQWAFQKNDQFLLSVKGLNFVQQGLTASLSGTHLMPLHKKAGHDLGTIDVSGNISGLELNKIGNYLPTAMNPDFRNWLSHALIAGTLRDGRIKLKGDLAHFPFHTTKPNEKPKGEFTFGGRIDDGGLNYAPDLFAKDGKKPMWPLLEKVKGTILFDRTRMEIKGESGKTNGADVSNVKAVIPDLLSDNPVLEIDGNAAGTLQTLVQYTLDSPVAEWIDHFTDETKASGNATLGLKLQLPLHKMIDAKVQGILKFNNNNVTLQNVIPMMSGTTGQLEFNEKGLTLNGVKSTFLGGPLTVSGGTQKDGNILIKADGTLTALGLRKNYPSPAMQKLTDKINGSTRFGVSIGVRSKRVDIVVDSNLRGLGLDFPAPLNKAAKDALPLKFEQIGLQSDSATMMRDNIKVALGPSIVANYAREKNTSVANPEWRVVYGGIGVNTPAPTPNSGLALNLSLRSLNVDDWLKVMATDAPDPKKKVAVDPLSVINLSQYVDPTSIAVRATELNLLDKKFDNVVLGATHDKGAWQANVDAAQMSGYITWIESSSGRGLGKVTARLSSLTIPKTANTEVKNLLDGVDTATEMPALDVIADNFELMGKKLGHLELIANYVRATEGREWRIRNLSLSNPDASLKASGSWLAKRGGNSSSLDYNMNINNAGNLLGRFGFADVLRGGKGKMEGTISWKGLPFSIDYPSLSGNINLDMASGQFLKVEPGAAKLLGVLSLQSIPRRLTLDFRDVFSDGFAFDGITGSANINNGVASTNNLKMRGVSATVLIDGSADIDKESQNLRAVVIPEINAGAASVAYALAVNPVIGAGTFLAQLFLREPLARAFTFEYMITGPWKDPNVTKVDRKNEQSSTPVPPPTPG